MKQFPNHADELEAGTFWKHKKSGVVYLVCSIDHRGQSAIISHIANGNRSTVAAAVLQNLYVEIDDDEVNPPEPEQSFGRFPVGSISIERIGLESTTPIPPMRSSPECEILSFRPEPPPKRRPGRPKAKVENFNSYFGRPRKNGPYNRSKSKL